MTNNNDINYSLSGSPRQDAPEQRRATEAEVRQALALAERMKLTGIGGWVAAFYVLYGFGWFFGIGLIIGMRNAPTDGLLNGMVVADWAGRIIMGLCLFAAHNSSSKPIRAGLIVQIACTVVQMFMGLSLVGHDLAPFIIMFLLYIGYCIAWLVYFSKSLRVKYTFDSRKGR